MKIQVGQISWEVVEDQYMEDELFGQTVFLGALVKLNPRITPEQSRETLLHELLHVLAFSAGVPLGDMEQEEAVINVLAPALLDVMCRNPQLMKKLLNN